MSTASPGPSSIWRSDAMNSPHWANAPGAATASISRRIAWRATTCRCITRASATAQRGRHDDVRVLSRLRRVVLHLPGRNRPGTGAISRHLLGRSDRPGRRHRVVVYEADRPGRQHPALGTGAVHRGDVSVADDRRALDGRADHDAPALRAVTD